MSDAGGDPPTGPAGPPPGPIGPAGGTNPTPPGGVTPPPGSYPPGAFPPPGPTVPGGGGVGPPPPGGYPTGPPPGPPPGGGKKMSTGAKVGIVVAVVVVLGLIGGGLAVLLTGDDAEAGEVFLDAAGSTGRDPFTESVSVGDEDGLDNAASSSSGSGSVSSSVGGDEVGLYGGTQDQTSCDPDQLVAFLEENDDKARAWADVQGIEVDDIADFVDDLTPVRLRADTRVTNHGFRDGRATEIQTVLQAGTAVLLDRTGLPRVRCACGNPLLAPDPVSGTPRYEGTRWSGFSPQATQVVVVQQTVDVFVLVDVDTGERFERPAGTTGEDDRAVDDEPEPTTTTTTEPPTTTTTEPSSSGGGGGLGTGDVQVTLRWQGEDDLDLHVTDPGGDEIYYGNPSSSSGGQLDVDDTAGCGDGGSHVENVFWPTGGAPSGTYSAQVEHFGGCDSGTTTSYTLEVRVGGSLVDSRTESVSPGGAGSTITFTVG